MMAAMQNAQRWSLRALLEGIAAVPEAANVALTGLCTDSRLVRPGEVFIAYPGLNTDGRDFIDDAIERGAVAVLSHGQPPTTGQGLTWRDGAGPVPVIAVPELTSQVGVLADRFFGSPSSSMYVIGVTGTNGKTSCSHYLAQAFSERGCGVIGTLGWGFTGHLQPSTHTTPEALSVHRWLAELHDQGAKSVAMEVSSHALDQQRVGGVHFDCAVFTNLSHEHLDYHGDMDRYGAAKRLLFQERDLCHAVINHDDAFGRTLVETLAPGIELLTYGQSPVDGGADIRADNIMVEHGGLVFDVHTPAGDALVRLPLLGRFNVSNALAVLGVLLLNDVPLEDAVARLGRLRAVPGRMQRFAWPGRPLVVVDYAHTPAALEHALGAVREHAKGRLWCVFGCGGDRDASKRGPMGRIAETQADRVVLTNDNPRSEDPSGIVKDIQAGMASPEKVQVILARDEAIAYALTHADAEDVVLVAGKGHENYQLIGNETIAFSDAGCVEQVLAKGGA
jgi:UDP-N-acetylmuramoyl-L-alanyl-D-glutamate--2,6-diaminopimelate ligase